jgi:circadian clock protein KaiC
MNHSNQIREYQLTSQGVRLVDAYLGSSGVLTGSARVAQEMVDAAAALRRTQDYERKQRDIERKRAALERQIEDLRVELESEEENARKSQQHNEELEKRIQDERRAMAIQRGGTAS